MIFLNDTGLPLGAQWFFAIAGVIIPLLSFFLAWRGYSSWRAEFRTRTHYGLARDARRSLRRFEGELRVYGILPLSPSMWRRRNVDELSPFEQETIMQLEASRKERFKASTDRLAEEFEESFVELRDASVGLQVCNDSYYKKFTQLKDAVPILAEGVLEDEMFGRLDRNDQSANASRELFREKLDDLTTACDDIQGQLQRIIEGCLRRY